MSKLSELSKKFAMKLSLESRPSMVGDLSPYEHTLEDIEPKVTPPMPLSKAPQSDATKYLNPIRAAIHELAHKIELGSLDEALDLISDTKHNLQLLSNYIKDKKSKRKKKAFIDQFASDTLSYHDQVFSPVPLEESEEEFQDTVFHDVENEPEPRMPAMVREFIQDLDYLTMSGLQAEKKRLRHIIKQLAMKGSEPTYLVKKRLEEVDKRLAAGTSAYL